MESQPGDSTARMAALDLMLKSLMASREFNEQANKNWEPICRMIPGTTVKQASDYVKLK